MAENIETITVGIDLDSDDFALSCKKVGEDLKHFAEEAREHAEHIKEHGEKMAEFWEKMKEHALEFFGIMASVGAFVAFTEHTIKAQTAMVHLSEETKMTVENISLWQNAVVIAGGSAEGFNQSLKGMGESLVAIEKGLPRAQRALKAFEAAHITGLGKGKHVEITDMYDKIHEKLSKLTMAEAMTLGKRMQLDEATIRVLHKTGEEYEEFMVKAKGAGVVTKEQAEASEKAEEAMNLFKISSDRATAGLSALLMPAIAAIANGLANVAQWAGTHGKTVAAAITGIGAAMMFLHLKTLLAIPSVIAHWAAETAGAIAATYALNSVAIAATAAWVATLWPVALVVAALAAVAAGFIWIYKNVEGFRDVVDAVCGWISRQFMILVHGVMQLWDEFTAVFEAVWDFIKAIFTGNTEKISEAWKSMTNKMARLLESMGAAIRYYVFHMAYAVIDAFDSIWPSVKKSASAFFDWFTDKFKLIGKVVGAVAKFLGKPFEDGMETAKAVGKKVVETAKNTVQTAGTVMALASMASATVAAKPVEVMHEEHAPTWAMPSPQAPTSAPPAPPAHALPKPAPKPKPAVFPTHETHAQPALLQAPTSTPPEPPKKTSKADIDEAWKKRNMDAKIDAWLAAQHKAEAGKKSGGDTNTVHVDTINVNAPNATDAHGVAGGITGALQEKHKDMVNQADGGVH